MKKILIVEDSKDMQMFVKLFIEQVCEKLKLPEKPVIEITVDEKQAIKLIRKGDYCLITLDGNIEPKHEGHGLNVLREIEESNPEILSRFIIICLHPKDSFLDFCNKRGIPMLDKADLMAVEEKLLPLIKKVFELN